MTALGRKEQATSARSRQQQRNEPKDEGFSPGEFPPAKHVERYRFPAVTASGRASTKSCPCD
jgi:hypothetical protein